MKFPLTLACLISFFMSSLISCRPPSLHDEWQRNPQIQRDQEMPGQKPMSIDIVNIGDSRPEFIRKADNPDYNPDSNVLRDTLDWIFGRPSASTPVTTVKIDPPPSGADNIDIYDIKGGKVNTSTDMVDPNDPEIIALRESARNTGNEFGSRSYLLEQRDYARARSEQLVNELNQKQIEPFSKEMAGRLQAMKGEVDAAVNGHNQSVNTVLAQMPENQNLPEAEGYEFKTAPYSANGQRVRAAQQSVNYAKTVVAQMNGEARVRGEAAVETAQYAVIAADKAYASGDHSGGDFALSIATTVVDVGIGLIPGVGLAKDAIEAVTGRNLVTGKKLSTFDRSMAVIGVLTGGVGSKLAVVGKAAIIVGIAKAGKNADEVVEIERAVAKAEKIVADGEKWGLKAADDVKDYATQVEKYSGPLDAGSIPYFKGAGPQPSVVALNDLSKSNKAFQNFTIPNIPDKGGAIEFVYDMKTNTVAAGLAKGVTGASPHQALATSIHANDRTQVLGGMLKRGPEGGFLTNENSGHFYRNWNDQTRKAFQDSMKNFGIDISHSNGMTF